MQQVKLLDQAVENLLKAGADLNNYRNLIDRIIGMDADDRAGLKAKYRAFAGLYDAEHLLLTDNYDRGMEMMRKVDATQLPESLRRSRDQRLIRMYFLTNRPAEAEKYVKEATAGTAAPAYKQELAAFLANRFKTDRAKATTWLKTALTFDKDGPGAADINTKLKAESAPVALDEAASARTPAFENVLGLPLKLDESKGKKVTVILFWTSAYKASLATLAELSTEYKNSDVEVFAVNVGDAKQDLADYLQKTKLDLNLSLDKDRAGANAFNIQHFPTAIVIGKDGMVRHTYLGLSALNKTAVKTDIDALKK